MVKIDEFGGARLFFSVLKTSLPMHDCRGFNSGLCKTQSCEPLSMLFIGSLRLRLLAGAQQGTGNGMTPTKHPSYGFLCSGIPFRFIPSTLGHVPWFPFGESNQTLFISFPTPRLGRVVLPIAPARFAHEVTILSLPVVPFCPFFGGRVPLLKQTIDKNRVPTSSNLHWRT